MTTAELHEIFDDENRKLTADANIIKLPRTEMFSVSRQTVLKWINNGKIKAVKVVKVYRIPKEEIDRLIDKQRKEDEKNEYRRTN